MPMYVKAGSIIPFGPEVQYAGQKSWDNLELKIYPGKDAEFVLYEDEGDNYNYEKGAYSTITIRWKNENRTLTIEDRQGNFSGMLEQRSFQVSVAGSQQKQSVLYSGQSINVAIN